MQPSACNSKYKLWRLCKNSLSIVRGYYCNHSGGVALIVWFTTNGMCAKNNTIIHVARASNRKRDCDVEALPILTCERFNVTTTVREERLRRMISIVACCHGAKLCAHAARDFRSHQYLLEWRPKRCLEAEQKHNSKNKNIWSSLSPVIHKYKHEVSSSEKVVHAWSSFFRAV